MTHDRQLAMALADAGMKQAVEHADREVPDWQERAYALFRRYLELTAVGDAIFGVARFQTEDVIAFADNRGLPEPPDRRAWGAVVRRALRAGLIRRVGYASQSSPSCHGSPKAVWEAVG